jgi:hypothetical protein
MTAERCLAQVALLLRTIPEIASEPDFALKGGTPDRPVRSRHRAPLLGALLPTTNCAQKRGIYPIPVLDIVS